MLEYISNLSLIHKFRQWLSEFCSVLMKIIKREGIPEWRISIKEISPCWKSWKLIQPIKDHKLQCFCTDVELVKLFDSVAYWLFYHQKENKKWSGEHDYRKEQYSPLFCSPNNKKELLIWNSGSSKSTLHTDVWLMLCSFSVDVRYKNKNWGVRTTASRSFQICLSAGSKLNGFTKWLFSHTYNCFLGRAYLPSSMKIFLFLP